MEYTNAYARYVEHEVKERDELITDLTDFHKKMGIKQDVFVDNPRIFEYIWAFSQMGDKENKRILDAGCGSSPMPVFFKNRYDADVTAIDTQSSFDHPTFSFNPEWKEQFGVNYVRANMIDYRAMPFDYVICISALEHIFRPIDRFKAILNLWENVKDGGRLIMTFDFMLNVAFGMQYLFMGVGRVIDCVNYVNKVTAICLEKVTNEGVGEWLQQNAGK